MNFDINTDKTRPLWHCETCNRDITEERALHRCETAQNARYGDWRDEIAANYPTSGPIPSDPYFEVGIWVDSGRMTADDACREVIRIAESWGMGIDPEMREIVDADGWEDDPDHSQWLVEYADNEAVSFITDVITGYGFDPEIHRAYVDLEESDRGLKWWVGWDGDAGGFGLWIEEDEDKPRFEHVHSFGPFEYTRLAGTLVRRCVAPSDEPAGCRVVSLDADDRRDDEKDEPEPVCSYCKLGPGEHRGSAFTTNGRDLEYFDRIHSRR